MITLFHAPHSRSSRMIFLLEELGAPYQIKSVDIRRGNGTGAADAANPHPHGKVPVIEDDGSVVFESAAIACYLTDKFPDAGIGPVVGSPLRGAYLTWLAYYAGVMEPAWVGKFMGITPPRGTAGWVEPDEVMVHVNRTLQNGPYLLGESFSAADILVATTFALFMGSPLLERTAQLEDYVQRVTSRPAFARAQARENALT
ncbi:glutathione S-transferase family protein [Paraburkholderia sacchari]|uniref:glutathione S-transferase family protein n=1 Tax=Paraburkholderia sacchari TaxID=159450 RepID=UPI001BCA8D67|nr:glutathione S-transferase family protein [Paraburkholderia sacchari]